MYMYEFAHNSLHKSRHIALLLLARGPLTGAFLSSYPPLPLLHIPLCHTSLLQHTIKHTQTPGMRVTNPTEVSHPDKTRQNQKQPDKDTKTPGLHADFLASVPESMINTIPHTPQHSKKTTDSLQRSEWSCLPSGNSKTKACSPSPPFQLGECVSLVRKQLWFL